VNAQGLTGSRNGRKIVKTVSTARESIDRRAYLVGRKLDQALDDQNVGVGSCLLVIVPSRRHDTLVGDTVKKQKAGRASWDKVPSFKSYRRKPLDAEDYFTVRGGVVW